jgi:hypothetical protein
MEVEDLETASSVGDFQRVRMLPQIDKISRAMMPSHRHAVVMWYCVSLLLNSNRQSSSNLLIGSKALVWVGQLHCF